MDRASGADFGPIGKVEMTFADQGDTGRRYL